MLCNDGTANGQQIVPKAWIADSLNADPSIFSDTNNMDLDNGAYRNQFWIRDVDRRILMARGVFGQIIYADLTTASRSRALRVGLNLSPAERKT